MSIIEDGKGSGKKVEVTQDNRLSVEADTESRIFHKSRDHKKAFSAYGKRNFVAANTNENVLSLTYDGSDNLFVKEIVFSSNDDDAKVEVYFDGVYVSGGTTVLPLNLNRTVSVESETTCLHGGDTLVVNTEPAKEFFDVRLSKSTFNKDFHGAVILSRGNNITVLGSVSEPGKKIRTMIYYYEDND